MMSINCASTTKILIYLLCRLFLYSSKHGVLSENQASRTQRAAENHLHNQSQNARIKPKSSDPCPMYPLMWTSMASIKRLRSMSYWKVSPVHDGNRQTCLGRLAAARMKPQKEVRHLPLRIRVASSLIEAMVKPRGRSSSKKISNALIQQWKTPFPRCLLQTLWIAVTSLIEF